jgi:RDD family protein
MNALGAARSPAGFWKRYVAYSIDLVLVWLAMELLCRLFFPSMGADEQEQLRALMASMQNPEAPPQDQTALLTQAFGLLAWLTVLSSLLYLVVGGAYFAFCESSGWQATPGKRMVGIKVVDAEGSRIGRGRAIARFLAAALSWLTLNIGHALAAWTPERRALHDYLADTRVENADPSRPEMPKWGWLVIGVQALLFVLMVVGIAMSTLATIKAANQF